MNLLEWKCNAQLEVADWGEGDAIVYLKDCGDLHVVSGAAKLIIQALQSHPMSSRDLEQYVNSECDAITDLNAINRQVTQLSSLGLVSECRNNE